MDSIEEERLIHQMQIKKLQDEYMWATECELSTWYYYTMRKSAPKSERNRHLEISKKMVAICKTFDIRMDVLRLPLLKKVLNGEMELK